MSEMTLQQSGRGTAEFIPLLNLEKGQIESVFLSYFFLLHSSNCYTFDSLSLTVNFLIGAVAFSQQVEPNFNPQQFFPVMLNAP